MSISCQKHTHIRKPTFGTRIRTQTQCRMSHFCTHRITDYSVICCSAQRGNMKLCELYLTPTAQCTSATVMLTFHSPQKQLQEVLVPVGVVEYDYLYSCCWLPTYLSFSLYVYLASRYSYVTVMSLFFLLTPLQLYTMSKHHISRAAPVFCYFLVTILLTCLTQYYQRMLKWKEKKTNIRNIFVYEHDRFKVIPHREKSIKTIE